ncbi:MAG: IclR family transcriptional regulator [Chloroflexi bacterium]|nr:IclR family transcriptional regulator [Chloroflexota bacterium]
MAPSQPVATGPEAVTKGRQRSARSTGDGGIRTLERALSILELLGSADSPMGLTVIAQRIDLPVGTTHRMLKALTAHGYVEQDLRTKWYELGLKVMELRGSIITQAVRMASDARPYLQSLSVATGLRCHLAIYRGGNVIYIDRVDSDSSGSSGYVPLGLQAPAYSTGLGKVLLAYAPAEEVEALLVSNSRQKFTSNTITEPEELREELRLTRQRGFAVDHGESSEFRSCIGAPIFDYRAHAIAAISVAGTVDDVTRRASELEEMLVAKARAISEHFGYRGTGAPSAR